MWYLGVVIVFALGFIISFSKFGFNNKAFSKTTAKNTNAKSQETNKDNEAGNQKKRIFYSRKDIKKKLLELFSKPKPKTLAMGAMCYEMAAPPERAEYVCPACGEKTIYTIKRSEFIQWYLPQARRMIKNLNIKGIGVKLDESQFCKKCSPKIENPQLCLHINYAGESKPHQVCSIYPNDIGLISEFMNGKVKHKTQNDEEEPLVKHIDRLQKLLGVNIKENDK